VQRFLYRVQYTYPDGTVSYESVCVRAADGDTTAALTDAETGTDRYRVAVNATRTMTLLVVTADV